MVLINIPNVKGNSEYLTLKDVNPSIIGDKTIYITNNFSTGIFFNKFKSYTPLLYATYIYLYYHFINNNLIIINSILIIPQHLKNTRKTYVLYCLQFCIF